MDEEELERLLKDVRDGKTSIEAAKQMLGGRGYEDLHYARIDHHRTRRKGFPEVIYCPGKEVSQIVSIAECILGEGDTLLATRANDDIYAALKERFPEVEYSKEGSLVYLRREPLDITDSNILVVTGGTSDIPVAEEAAVTAEVMGCRVNRLYDVGVAGVHRLLDNKDVLEEATVIVVVAGMEGALASVVGGLVKVPVIAVPTSVGYGASFQGLSALLTMLNSCASGVTVVNIDNGYGGGYAAAQIVRLIHQEKEQGGLSP